MATNEITNEVPAEFNEIGIKPLAYGQPELPKAPAYKSLARQIERDGVKDEAGNDLARPDPASAEALARPFVHPRASAAAALKAPIYKHLQAGTVALVHGAVFMTRVNPSLLNPRVSPMIAIPSAGSDGRVAVGWAPFDVGVDPQADERLMQSSGSLDELVESSRVTADKVLGLQQELSEVIGREGIEEPLLIVQTRLDVDGTAQPARTYVPIGADGGSRITIAQEHLADAIALLLDEKETYYATKHKRRGALEDLERALRAHQPATLVDDPVAERELRDFLVELSSRPAADLVKNGMFAAQRALVAPAMVVVGFRPNEPATIIEAIDQLVANQHKRGPLQWQPAAQALDSRNSVVRALRRDAKIGDGKALLLGPRYEEATRNYDISANPDFRIGEVVRIFHGADARRPIREAIGASGSQPPDRGKIITAVIGEQLHDADPAFRKQAETALRDIVVHPPFFGSGIPDLRISDPEPGDLVEEVKRAEKAAPGDLSEAHVELGVKGGTALVMLGALDRAHGELASNVPRPYNTLQRMLHDSFGQELLGEALEALRAGKRHLPGRDPETREPLGPDSNNRIVPMEPDDLRGLMAGNEEDDQDETEPNRTTDDVFVEAKSIVRNQVGDLIEELKGRPDVVREGIAPHKAKELSDLLLQQAMDVDHLGRRGTEHLHVSGEPETGQAAGDGAVA